LVLVLVVVVVLYIFIVCCEHRGCIMSFETTDE
jgi:hypothetical protein